MKNKKRRRISEQGMKMIESVLKNQNEEFAMEHRIEDQLRFNLGEEYFRKLETEVLEELSLNLSNTVVSTGGGMPLKEGNARFLKKIGKVFYLKASSSSIYERVKDDTGRPLLQVKDPYAKVCELLEIRNPIYETASDFILDTDRREVETIASTITSNI